MLIQNRELEELQARIRAAEARLKNRQSVHMTPAPVEEGEEESQESVGKDPRVLFVTVCSNWDQLARRNPCRPRDRSRKNRSSSKRRCKRRMARDWNACTSLIAGALPLYTVRRVLRSQSRVEAAVKQQRYLYIVQLSACFFFGNAEFVH